MSPLGQTYIILTCTVAFIALLGVVMSRVAADHKWSRICAQAFFLSPCWPLAVPLVLIWLGVKAWGPEGRNSDRGSHE